MWCKTCHYCIRLNIINSDCFLQDNEKFNCFSEKTIVNHGKYGVNHELIKTDHGNIRISSKFYFAHSKQSGVFSSILYGFNNIVTGDSGIFRTNFVIVVAYPNNYRANLEKCGKPKKLLVLP